MFLGRTLYWGDIGLYFDPMLRFLRENLQAGTFPLWNPHILCGAPFVGNPQSWPLYPSSALLFAMPSGAAINWMIALHVWIAGLGTFYFLRIAAGRGVPAALLGAVAFMFGGQLISKEQFPNMVQAAAYLPWVLLAVHSLCERPCAAAVVFLGTVLGLQILAAHQQMVALTCYLAIVYAAPLLIGRRDARHFARAIGGAAGAVALAALLSLGQLLPAVEFFAHILRQRYTFAIVNRFYLPVNQLQNFILPTLHGHPYFGTFTARGNFWETCCYIGWVPFLLMLTGSVIAWGKPSYRSTRIWSIVFILGVLMAMGGKGHVYYFAFRHLPGFRNFHDPARCLLWSCFAVSVLAAAGLDWLVSLLLARGEEGGASRYPKVTACVLAAVLIAAAYGDLCRFGATIYPLSLHPVTEGAGRSQIVRAVLADRDIDSGQARIIAPDSARAWQRFTPHRSYRQGVRNYDQLWYDTLTPNLGMSAGIDDAYGYDPITRADAQTILGSAAAIFGADQPQAQRNVAASWAGACGVRYVVTDRIFAPEALVPGLTPALSRETLATLLRPARGRVSLSRDAKWQPRARLVTQAVWYGDPNTAAWRMAATLYTRAPLDLSKVTLLSGTPSQEASIRPVLQARTAAQPAMAQIVTSSPDHVVIQANAPSPAVLVLADTVHPGWTCAVDGHPSEMLVADGFMRATPVSAGNHAVVFRYRPTSFLLGLYGSLVALSGILAFWLSRWLLRRQPGARDGGEDAGTTLTR